MPYTISDAAMADAITQSSYVQIALANLEAHSPPRVIDVAALHKQLNALALISANAVIDTSTSLPVASDTFGGSGNVSGTTPQSAGVGKGT